MIDRLIDPKELARELGVPVSWIYSRTRQKGPDTIPHLKLGKYCRFRLEEVLEWLKKKQEQQDHAQYRSRKQHDSYAINKLQKSFESNSDVFESEEEEIAKEAQYE